MNEHEQASSGKRKSYPTRPQQVIGKSNRGDSPKGRAKISDGDALLNRGHRSRATASEDELAGVHGARSAAERFGLRRRRQVSPGISTQPPSAARNGSTFARAASTF